MSVFTLYHDHTFLTQHYFCCKDKQSPEEMHFTRIKNISLKNIYRSPTSSSASGVGRGLSTPYSPYLTSFYSSHNTDSGNFRPARFRETTPLRYSSTPRISSRFL